VCVYTRCVCVYMCVCIHCRRDTRMGVIVWIDTCGNVCVYKYAWHGAFMYVCMCVLNKRRVCVRACLLVFCRVCVRVFTLLPENANQDRWLDIQPSALIRVSVG